WSGPAATYKLRARRDSSLYLRTLQRHASGDGTASRNAVLPRQLAIAVASRQYVYVWTSSARHQRKLRARTDGTAHARCGWRIYTTRRRRGSSSFYRLDDL